MLVVLLLNTCIYVRHNHVPSFIHYKLYPLSVTVRSVSRKFHIKILGNFDCTVDRQSAISVSFD